MSEIMNELNTFSELPDAGNVSTNASADANNEAKKRRVEEMRSSLKATIQSDPTFIDRLHKLSESIEVVNSLGWGENGNIMVDAKNTDGRTLQPTSAIVGYSIRNKGTEPIPYETEVWTQNEDGKFTAQKVGKVLSPGETANLTRQFMTKFCAMPEISFQLANGKVIRGSGNKAAKGDLKAELEAYYFSFNKDLGIQVNSDDVKLNVGVRDEQTNQWHVKPEYVETFGYLENAPEKSRGRKKTASKFNASDLAANYVMRMIRDNSL